MARFMKRSIAMLLVLNMLTGMIPAQALAAKGSSGKVKVTVSASSKSKSKSSSSKSKSKSSSSSSSSKSSSAKSSVSKKSTSKKLEAKMAAEAKAVAEAEAAKKAQQLLDSQLTTKDPGIDVKENTDTFVKTDADGNLIITTTTQTITNGTLKGGELINGQETYTQIITNNPDGVEIGSFAWIEGQETIEDNDPAHEFEADVTVQLIPGQTASNKEIVEKLLKEGEKPEKFGEGEYMYAETLLKTEKSVEVNTTENAAKVEVTGTSELTPLIPDRTIVDDGDLSDEQLLKEYTYSDGFDDYDPTTAPEGYDYRLEGFGQMSMFGNATNTTKGKTGALQFELQYDPDFVPNSQENKEITEEDIFTAYCVDITTDGKDNWWYRIDSLDDAGYYDEEAADHIRAIALGGYWGTSNAPDKNGAYQTGSLEKLKSDMKAAVKAGKLEGVTTDMIDSLTEGQALNATQNAIWMYANATTEGAKVDTDRLITSGFHSDKSQRVEPTEEEVANVRAVFDYLLALDPVEKGEHEEVIDQDNYIVKDSMSITVGEKVEHHENNHDHKDDNDVYSVDLNFALVVTPSDDGDDLVVQVVRMNANGESVVEAQGRIAGGDAEQDKANGFNDVRYDKKTGTYTLTDLELAENSPFDFELKLVGTQYLEQGVYLFKSEIRDGVSSQTMIGIAGGDKEVNVSKGFKIEFNVEEQSTSVSKRYWREDNDPTNDPGYNRRSGDIPTPADYRLTRGVGQLEIIDEEVPLAEPPQTGDISMLYFAMILMSGLGLCMLNLLEKKREEA